MSEIVYLPGWNDGICITYSPGGEIPLAQLDPGYPLQYLQNLKTNNRDGQYGSSSICFIIIVAVLGLSNGQQANDGQITGSIENKWQDGKGDWFDTAY